MMASLFPLEIPNEQAYLLTAIVLGFGFGFALERGGFGSARKLAAQFYLHDMAVFKVMFTAILVAMVGFYAGVAVGLVDPARMWINPTFVWAQLVGGFLLGVGFIVSGLCPGTSVVSLASGRIDAAFAFAGVFVGTFLFAILVDLFPAVERLYEGGSLGVSVLPALLGVPGPVVALAVVVMAALGFAGAEKLERRFRPQPLESTPPDAAPEPERRPNAVRKPGLRWALVGGLAAVAITSGFARPGEKLLAAPRAGSIEPLVLAEALVANANGLLIVDLREAKDPASKSIPGAVPGNEAILAHLESMPPGSTVVVFDADGTTSVLPDAWPVHYDYQFLGGGFAAWEREVLTPRSFAGASPDEREAILRQQALAAWFSGTQLEAARPGPPPVAAPTGGVRPKKKSGGC